MNKGHPDQFVRVEFTRSICDIRPGQPRHAWHWCILVQGWHLRTISGSFASLAEAVADFEARGVQAVAEVEAQLAALYCKPTETPYDVGMVNQ